MKTATDHAPVISLILAVLVILAYLGFNFQSRLENPNRTAIPTRHQSTHTITVMVTNSPTVTSSATVSPTNVLPSQTRTIQDTPTPTITATATRVTIFPTVGASPSFTPRIPTVIPMTTSSVVPTHTPTPIIPTRTPMKVTATLTFTPFMTLPTLTPSNTPTSTDTPRRYASIVEKVEKG